MPASMMTRRLLSRLVKARKAHALQQLNLRNQIHLRNRKPCYIVSRAFFSIKTLHLRMQLQKQYNTKDFMIFVRFCVHTDAQIFFD